MFCKNCGKEIPNESRFCPNCGQETGYASTVFDFKQQNESSYQESNPAVIALCFAVVSMILGIVGMLFGLASRDGIMLILAILALVFCRMSRNRNQDTILGMARAGKILGIIEIIICVIVLIFIYGIFQAMF